MSARSFVRAANSFIANRYLADAPVTVRYGDSYSVCARASPP